MTAAKPKKPCACADIQRRYDRLLADMKAIARTDLRNNAHMHAIAREAIRREAEEQSCAG